MKLNYDIYPAIECLYRDRYDYYVKKLSYRVGGVTNAEDIVQEAFARALRYSCSYKPDKDIGGWFNTILNNAQKEFKSAEKRKGSALIVSEEEQCLDAMMYKKELVEQAASKMGDYPPHVSEMLHLFFILEFKIREISEATEYHISTVKDVLRRFRDDMKALYGEDAYEY